MNKVQARLSRRLTMVLLKCFQGTGDGVRKRVALTQAMSISLYSEDGAFEIRERVIKFTIVQCQLLADSFHLPGKHFTQPFRR
jgi:hypothetical protein